MVIGRGWISKFNKKDIYFVMTIGNAEYKGNIDNRRLKIEGIEKDKCKFINKYNFIVNDKDFYLAKSTVKTYDYKIIMR